MKQTLGLGFIGCGDYLRLNLPELAASTRVRVAALFDADPARAERIRGITGGEVRASASAVIADPAVDIVVLFVPPWVRAPLVIEAARAGKAILTTKPIASDVADCATMLAAVEQAGVACGVIYNRTENAVTAALKTVFASGEIGGIGLYRQDWLHHYPKWNNWATDPAKNGGPFMDAMIHNLNRARYLFGRPVARATFFRDNIAHPELRCADTESLKLDFADGGTAYLFITWAADLAVHSTTGNDREHIDLFYCITELGWRVTVESQPAASVVVASRLGETRQWPVKPFARTVFDEFVAHLKDGAPWPERLPSLAEAAADIRLLRETEKQIGTAVVGSGLR